MEINKMKLKQCCKCKEKKPLDQFGKYASSKDGLNYRCKTCMNLASKLSKRKKKKEIGVEAYNKYHLEKTQLSNARKIKKIGKPAYDTYQRKLANKSWRKRLREDPEAFRKIQNEKAAKVIAKHKATDLPSYRKSKRLASLKTHYQLTERDFLQIKEKQDYKCAICGTPFFELNKEPSVDHDHALEINGKPTKESIRGLLCHYCNSGLGYFKDNVEFLLQAATYLEAFKYEKTA